MAKETALVDTIKCEYCNTEYTKTAFNALKVTGHNIVWDFEYRECAKCGKEIALFELYDWGTWGK